MLSFAESFFGKNSLLREIKSALRDLRCTMDSFEDYIRVCRIFKGEQDPVHVSWEALCRKLNNINQR